MHTVVIFNFKRGTGILLSAMCSVHSTATDLLNCAMYQAQDQMLRKKNQSRSSPCSRGAHDHHTYVKMKSSTLCDSKHETLIPIFHPVHTTSDSRELTGLEDNLF